MRLAMNSFITELESRKAGSTASHLPELLMELGMTFQETSVLET